MKRVVLGALALMMAGGGARALTDDQLNVLSHLGQVIAGEQICPSVKVDHGMVAMLIAAHGIDLDDAVQGGVVRSKIAITRDAWRDRGEMAACAAVMMLYGPGGANVPNLLEWK